MSALDFLGGLAGTYSSIDKGIKDAEDRDQLKKDREYQAQTRQYELGQQKRKVEEQARADKLREADAAVSTTEQVTTPESKAIYGNDAAVTRDDEGNLMPGAIEKPATTVTRNRSMYDVFRDYAKNRRDAGDATGALDFQTKAIKVATDQASRQATGLIGQSASMSLEQYAQGAVKLFNNDALPQSIRDVKTNADGSVTATIFHNDTNQSMPVTFKTKAELTNAIRSQYQPEVYGKLLEKQAEIEAEAAKERAKAVTTPAGGVTTFGVGDPRGKVENDTGYVWTGRLNPDGSREMVKAGAGGGKSGKAEKTNVEVASEYLKDAMGGKGDGSPEGAARYTRAQAYLDGVFSVNPNVSPRMAAAIASDAASDPTKISLQLDNRTGQISKVYRNPDFEGGRQFNLGANAGTIQEMEKQVGKSGMTEAVNGMVGELSSAIPQEQQAVFRTQLLKAATDPVSRKAALDAAKDNGQDVQAMARQLDLIKAYGAPAPAPQRTLNTGVGGMKPQPVDPNSPAGRSQARQAQLRADADKKEVDRMESQKTLSKQFQADKASMSAEELARKYDASRGQLPTADAAELRRIESQAYRVGK